MGLERRKETGRRVLKGCLVGFGRMGVAHYSILNTHPDVVVTAISDSSRIVLSVLKRYASLAVYTDFRKMFDEAGADFVIVATPPHSHAEILREAIHRGIHVFVEKPLTSTVAEGRDVVAALAGVDLVNQVGYLLRFSPVFQETRKIILANLLGDIAYYKNEMYGRTVLRPARTSWRSQKEAGGGCMLDFASHCVDLVHYLFGPTQGVSGCYLKRIFSADVDDAVFATFEHQTGIIGEMIVNWSDASYRRAYNRIEVFGSNGRIVADRQELRLFLCSARPGSEFVAGWNVRYSPELAKGVRFCVRGSDLTCQMDHFVQCVKEKQTETACTFREALQTDLVMEQIQRSAVTRGD